MKSAITLKPPASVVVPKRTPPRMIKLAAFEYPHPELIRAIFSCDALKGFPIDKSGAHIKLFFPRAHQKEPLLPILGANGPVWPAAENRPTTRTYTVRYYCAETRSLAVDFAKHDHQGPAQRWLNNAKINDRIGLAGPGGPDPLIADRPIQILVGDVSALPAISALLNEQSCARKMVFLVANHCLPERDRHGAVVKLFKPSEFKSFKVLYQHLLGAVSSHIESLKASNQDLPNDLAAFVAGENNLVLQIRDYLRKSCNLNKVSLYAIPYWRMGQDEEVYHQTRHHIMDEVY